MKTRLQHLFFLHRRWPGLYWRHSGRKDIANDEMKVLTKELHGTRPKNLIISLLYGFLQHSDIKEIYAIDSDFHVKSEKVQTSYSALWLEVGGEKHRRGWYKLPPQEIKKV
jgi:uncharacterized protein VirK/YbjX